MTLLEDIARGIYETEPMSDAGEAIDGFQITPPAQIKWASIVECEPELYETYKSYARAVLAAIEASGTHVIVPTEATREMLYAFNIHRADSMDQYGWNEVLSARPKVT